LEMAQEEDAKTKESTEDA